ncbi:Serine/threonine-protein kinase PRP4 like protein [Termitomyces sp. J132]|nr:Serine/threonine-protein kinase PRP4 like protein [Termitomyces sp. J132]
MTNATSGHKRSWDGADNDSHKRPREEARDWRDVHLKSSDRRSSANKGGADKGYSDGRRRDDRRRDDDRKRDDHRRVNDYRGRRDDRERERERERDRDRGHREERRRSASREEGEISPRPDDYSSRYRDHSPRQRDNIPRRRDNSLRRSPHPEPSSAPPSAPAPPPRPPSPLPEMELDLPLSPPPVEDLMAARRAKREAIRAKYNGVESVDATPSPSSAVQPPPLSSNVSDAVTRAPSISGTPVTPAPNTTSRRDSMSASPAPEDFALAKDGEEEGVSAAENTGAEQISAADYDPSLDRREDEQRRIREPALADEVIDVEEEEEVEEVEEEEDVDDMFAVATTAKKLKKVKKTLKQPAVPALVTTNLDSAADPEGYYTVILGEQLDGQYQVFSSIGKGMFANVVRARVIAGDPREIGKEVAIKIVRCQESMYKAGQKEAGILAKLREADPDDRKHIVRLERTFEHRGHLCLVFEAMSMNLRDVVKRFGKDVGLNIRAVRAYAHQLFLSLGLLRKCNIMHADIKPDNILVNEQKTLLKLCDLGSASDAAENDITPYLVSRFYRAPEIILGVPYDPALDIWSIGCTLYELYTGKILFPGRSNNQMLLLMMELKGRFNSKMIKRAKFGDVYFDDMSAFESVETDRVTGAAIVRKVHISKPTRDLRARLMPPASAKLKDDENKLIVSFIDLLDKCLALDPARRITPKEALTHPFVRG